MRPPRFWFNPPDRPGLAAHLLSPLAAIWTAVTAARLRRSGTRVPVPVICVGNLTIGGTGKTPTTIALADRLRDRAPHILSRGHGGRLKGPLRVDPARHGAAEVGDEPLLLAAFAPVWIGADRVASARAAIAAGARLLIMDDGFQNPGLARDLQILVIDATTGFGNGRVIPAGPLREPVASGLARADLTLAIGPRTDRTPPTTLTGRLEPLGTGMDWQGLRTLAFAGIGRPEKFFDTLRGLGADLVATRAFDDHEPFTARLLRRLEADAAAHRAQLVTTEKDAARLPAAFRRQVLVLPVRLAIDNPAPLDAALAKLSLGA